MSNRIQPSETTVLPRELWGAAPRRRSRQYVRILAFASDVLAITLAFVLTGAVRFADTIHDQPMRLLAALLPIYIAISISNSSYSVDGIIRLRTGASRAITAFLIAVATVSLALFFLKVSFGFSRSVLGIGSTLTIVLIPAMRLALRQAFSGTFARLGSGVVILVDGNFVSTTSDAIVLDARRYDLQPRLDDPAMLDRLGRWLQHVERVIVACAPEQRDLWAAALKGADVNAEVFASELDAIGPLGMHRFEGMTTLVVAVGPLRVVDRLAKRALDVMLVLAAMPVLLPMMALIALVIKCDSPGPVLFKQHRVGLGNRLFYMYKFRSMHTRNNDSAGSLSTLRTDQRVTRVGRVLRRTSLDELPQVFNVLSGAMSVVGPRPHALGSRADDKLFWDIDMTYWHRHAVKPGMTGLAQVRGFRGSTETTADLTNRLQADLEYVDGWSIWRDLWIIFATVRVLLHRNAF